MHATMVHIDTKAISLYMQIIASDSTDAVVQAYAIKLWHNTKKNMAQPIYLTQ